MSNEAKRKLFDAAELVGTFFFGSRRAVHKKAEAIAKDIDGQVERARARRRLVPSDPDAIETEGEEAEGDGDE